MSWEITVQFDLDQEDVGSVAATWTDPVLGVFTYSKRVKANAVGANAFIAEAIEARDIWQVKQQANITGATWVLNKINTVDPQVEV